jgi:glutathione S-transferase
VIKVLGRPNSINVRKVLWLCDELGLAIEREDWGREYRSTDDPAFRALNPNGLVPVLLDDDFVLWESNSICRYLAARERRADLLPTELRGRAQVEQWMDWQATELNGAWRYAFHALARRSPAHADPAAIASSIDAWNQRMTLLDAQLARTGAHVTGAGFTLADIVLGLSTHRWFALPIERPRLPAVEAYYERLTLRDGFRRHGRNGLP